MLQKFLILFCDWIQITVRYAIFVLYLLLYLKIFVIVKDIHEIHMLKNIQKKKHPLLNPDLIIRASI